MDTALAPDRKTRSTAATALRWRIVRDGARPGAENMAVDHALARCLRDGEAVLRLYSWSRPTISFGRNEPASEQYSPTEIAARGFDVVRRPTGGRAVLHDRELTYSVVVPARAFGGPRDAYRCINEALAASLRRLGIDAGIAEGGPALGPDQGPCFRGAAPGEVVVGGRKLVGSAQARVEGALLQHGSILLGGRQSRLDELRGEEPAGTEEPVTLTDLVGETAVRAVQEAIASGFAAAVSGSWEEGDLRPDEHKSVEVLEQGLYGVDSWTWRR